MSQTYELTNSQKNIWVLEQLSSDKKTNVISGYFLVETNFNYKIAEKTINKYIETNEGIRLKLTNNVGNYPMQEIKKYEYQEIPVIDVSKLNEVQIKELKDSIIEEALNIYECMYRYYILDYCNGKRRDIF